MKQTRNEKGQLHSFNDEPAYIDTDGTKYYYQDGVIHRGGDQPAQEWADGSKMWYQHGVMNRDNGLPALIDPTNNIVEWYINGELISELKDDEARAWFRLNMPTKIDEFLQENNELMDELAYHEKIEEARERTIKDNLDTVSEFNTQIPDHVRRHLLGDMNARLSYAGDQLSIGEADYSTLEDLQNAVGWFVNQLGGAVTWEKK